MSTTRRAFLFTLALLVAAPWPCLAQAQPGAVGAVALTPAEMEDFLLNAKIVKKKEVSKGVTKARRVTLSNGTVTHDAQVQDVDIALPIFNVGPKHSEVNFKDSYRYNIAAYRLAMLLGMDNVPMSVERKVEGKPAAMTWWLDGVMDEADRRKKKIVTTNPSRTDSYYSLMKVFDELIQNRDRNAGNIVWASDEKMWLIDHTRAFRLGKDLLKPTELHRVDRALLEKMRMLSREAVVESVGKTLTKDEVDALFVRRDRLVEIFDKKIAERGEGAVLYALR
jgi:hypothetical protein